MPRASASSASAAPTTATVTRERTASTGRKRTSRRSRASASPSTPRRSSASPGAARARAATPPASAPHALGARRVATLALWATVAFAALATLFALAPEFPRDKCSDARAVARVALPSVLGGEGSAPRAVKMAKGCAQAFHAEHPVWMTVLYVATYVTMQTFAVPGPPLMLSLLSGAVWQRGAADALTAQALIALSATTGASMCYLMSRSLRLGDVARDVNPPRFEDFEKRVARERREGNLFWFLLFIRLTPLFPNWFVNLVSPMVGVPLRVFAAATLTGLIPANMLHYQTGYTIDTYDPSAPTDVRHVAGVVVLSLLALAPVAAKKLYAGRFKPE